MKTRTAAAWGVLTGMLLAAGAVFAASGLVAVNATVGTIGLTVNGQPVAMTAQPISYASNIYLPLSTVAHALGATVRWVNHPPAVVVASPPSAQTFPLLLDGQPLTPGITNGFYQDVPATGPDYEKATGIRTTVAANGNVEFAPYAQPGPPPGSTPLLRLKPKTLTGDFANAGLYPKGRLDGYWPVTVIGQMSSGNQAIEWGVNPGQTSVLPGVSYNLAGKYHTLTGTFAIDDLSKNFGGAARIVFVGDGRPIGESPWVESGQEPQAISTNVSGVNVLTVTYQVRMPDGRIIQTGQTFKAPSVNPDGLTSDPILVTDWIDPALS